jgi:hypothetical protein
MSDEFSLALDECISKIATGEWSEADCERAYPKYWDELAGILQITSDVRASLTPPNISADFQMQSKARLLNQLRAQGVQARKPAAPPRKIGLRFLRPVPVLLSLVLLIAVMASGVGVVQASASSIPGDGLYPVKRTYEEIRLVLATRPEVDRALLLNFADERLNEMEAALQGGRAEDADRALEGYSSMVERILGFSAGLETQDDPDGVNQIQDRLMVHQAVLENVLEQAPESAKSGLSNAIERSQHASEVLQSKQDGESPSELAPGQMKKSSDEPDESAGEPDKQKTPKVKDKDKDNNQDQTPGPPPWVTPGPKKNK